MSKELADQLRDADLSGVDLSDSGDIANLLGYDKELADLPADGDFQGDTEMEAPAAAPAPAAATTKESSTAPVAATGTQAEIAGVLTKDGKHVIPHQVLQDERKRASLERQRATDLAAQNEILTAEIAALKSGKPLPAGETAYSPEELAELESDFPQLSPLLRTVEKLQKQATEQPRTTASRVDPNQVANEEADRADLFDVALAPRPLLSKYQQTGGVVWDRAVEIDNGLRKQAAFADMPMAERFAEVEKLLAQELGVSLGSTTNQTPATAAAKPAPKPSVPTQIMPTLTDLGGRSLTNTADPLGGMTKGQMVDKAMSMDMESLRKMAGLSY